ncbi:MAG: hypothetical protein ACXAC7_16895 [Candidatus Hodarchaeales archaeon]|jgi:hypothetical protein
MAHLQKLRMLYTAPTIKDEKKKFYVTFDFDEKSRNNYGLLFEKISEIIHEAFRKGPLESGATLATLHFTFFQKKSELGLQCLRKLIGSYLQTLKTPYHYTVFLHSYIIRWFRLIVVLDSKTRELFHFLIPPKNNINYTKLIDSTLSILPSINPDLPLPNSSVKSKNKIDQLFQSNVKDPKIFGNQFSKFYSSILRNILNGREKLMYLLEIQTLLGPKFDQLSCINSLFIETVGNYFFLWNEKIKESIMSINDKLNNRIEIVEILNQKRIVKKFSGTFFSEIVSIKKPKISKHEPQRKIVSVARPLQRKFQPKGKLVSKARPFQRKQKSKGKLVRTARPLPENFIKARN